MDERHAPQKEQQLTSTMLPYLLMVRMLQHWREWDSSSGGMATVLYLMTAARDFVCTLRASVARCTLRARISRASILSMDVVRILLLNRGRLARASFLSRTIVHQTYQGILIQNPCRRKLATNNTTH